MKLKSVLLSLVAVTALASCGVPKQISYFQDVQDGGVGKTMPAKQIRIRPQDQVSIIVSSGDPRLANMFNLAFSPTRIGQSVNITSSYSQGVCGYLVDDNGEIDFPVVGKIHLEGLTRSEASEVVKAKLMEGGLVRDPVVTVDFMNLKISVLGEVNHGGRFPIDRDDLTVLDAISLAGDLTIYGVRTDVTVARTEGDEVKYYKIDLTSSESLLSSPVYYLQQNDVVYVAPNDMRKRQSTLNGNSVLSSSFWMSMASFLVTLFVALR